METKKIRGRPRMDASGFIGRQFGGVTLLGPAPFREGHTMVLCRCKCGKEFETMLSLVKNRYVRSCGCRSGTRRSRENIMSCVGQRFGSLVVEGVNPARAGSRTRMVCRCDCGRVTEVELKNLLQNNTRSCGCRRHTVRAEKMKAVTDARVAAYTGRRFGKLTVEGLVPGPRAGGKPMLTCRCDCGGHKNVCVYALEAGIVKSCGCLIYKRMVRIPDGREVPALEEAARHGVKKCTFEARLKYGWTMEEAAFTPPGKLWRRWQKVREASATRFPRGT